MNLTNEVRALVDDTLALGGRLNGMQPEGDLLGAIPELDSVGVISVLTALEDRYGLTVDDEEISADTFETLGSLVSYVREKCAARG